MDTANTNIEFPAWIESILPGFRAAWAEVSGYAQMIAGMSVGDDLTMMKIPNVGLSLGRLADQNDEIQRFRVVSVHDDYMKCVFQDGDWEATLSSATSTSDLIWVAKPPRLQKTIWDGATYPFDITGTLADYTYDGADTTGQTRTAALNSDPGTTESQEVMNPYQAERDVSGTIYAGSEIYAVKMLATIEAASSTERIMWMDINADGRAWAKTS